MRRFIVPLAISLLALGGCTTGAVRFAPTPLPPDQQPQAYQHPRGAFRLTLPYDWAVQPGDSPDLASASFTPPGAAAPLLLVAAANLGSPPDADTFTQLVDAYQTRWRPDVGNYKEIAREALPDGSWRIAGLYEGAADRPVQVNTFVQAQDGLLLVIEAVLPTDPALLAALERAVSTVTIGDVGTLPPVDPSQLALAAFTLLEPVNIATWTAPDGAFFITGEVRNHGLVPVRTGMVDATLTDSAGDDLATMRDQARGHFIESGGFAPFGVRFGAGQPDAASGYRLALAQGWEPVPEPGFISAPGLAWDDAIVRNAAGDYVVEGTVTNTTDATVSGLVAVATLFDASGAVTGVDFAPVAPPTLPPGASGVFAVLVQDTGADPVNYALAVQGRLGAAD
jgi:hypothetical protein